MESLFLELKSPYCKLIDCISILGLSVSTLRSNFSSEIFLNDQISAAPEIILQLPPSSEHLKPSHMEVFPT